MTTKRRNLIVPSVIVGILLLAVAIVYWVEPAGSLPSFFPGHESGSSHHHFKHGIAAFVLALGCFTFAWFQSGPQTKPTDSQTKPTDSQAKTHG